MARYKKFESVEQLENAINKYFHECDTRQKEFITKDGETYTKTAPKPYTIEGLAVALEIDRRTLLNYETIPEYAEFFPTIKKAKAKILANLTERALDGDNNPAITIFNLKNNYGFRDKDPDDGADHNVNINIKYPE